MRLYGPPLRLAEASRGRREASPSGAGRGGAASPPPGSLRAVISPPISLPLRAVAGCENASPARTGAAASAAAAAAAALGGGGGGGGGGVGWGARAGRRGGEVEVRGGTGQRVCFLGVSLQSGGSPRTPA